MAQALCMCGCAQCRGRGDGTAKVTREHFRMFSKDVVDDDEDKEGWGSSEIFENIRHIM